VSELFQKILSDPNLIKPYFSWTEQALLDETKNSKCLLVYTTDAQNDKPIAFILYRPLPDFFEIIALATDPEFRNNGVLSSALDELSSTAKISTDRLLLEVHSNNLPAINLYKKNNFIVVGSRTRYYQDGNDALVMEKKLN
jgi:ribosomal-protein-alanine N-acetyltransferase